MPYLICRLDIKSKAPLVLAELLFSQSIAAEVKKHRLLLLRFTHQDTKAQRSLLGGLEQVIALHKDTLLPKTAVILKVWITYHFQSVTCYILYPF